LQQQQYEAEAEEFAASSPAFAVPEIAADLPALGAQQRRGSRSPPPAPMAPPPPAAAAAVRFSAPSAPLRSKKGNDAQYVIVLLVNGVMRVGFQYGYSQ
jgi:hypothetical protein